MMEAELRRAVRVAFGGCCGYCGVSETAIGGELEIDHFWPQAAGGGDEIENLVYACTSCNRFKGDYSPGAGAPESLWLLHPLRDEMSEHIAETAWGDLLGITARGWFHIQRLHLNRPMLIELRRSKRIAMEHERDIERAGAAMVRLRRENELLRDEVLRLRAKIEELLRGGVRMA